MSRDFILVFSGGMVALITTLIVLFVADYFYRRERERGGSTQATPSQPPATVLSAATWSPQPSSVATLIQKFVARTKPQSNAPPSVAPPGVPKTAGQPVASSTPTAPVEAPTTSAPISEVVKPSPAPASFPPPPETITNTQT
jgi:hypothetical protein